MTPDYSLQLSTILLSGTFLLSSFLSSIEETVVVKAPHPYYASSREHIREYAEEHQNLQYEYENNFRAVKKSTIQRMS